MTKFQKGDKVRLLRGPEGLDYDYGLTFVSSMFRFVGKEVVLESGPDRDGHYSIFNYWWHPDWLELVEENGMTDINELKTKLQEAQALCDKLQSQIEAEKNKKWEPKGGDWFMLGNGAIVYSLPSTPAYRAFGSEFETKEAAEKASKAYRQYHRLYKLAEELNEGWEPDWNDFYQEKYYVFYNHSEGDFHFHSTNYMGHCSGIYFKNHSTARKAVEMLRNSALN